MTEEEAIEISSATCERDPRKAPYGILNGGSFVLDSVRVFMWFETTEELADHLANVLPASFQADEDSQAEFSVRVAPLLAGLEDPANWPAIVTAYNAEIREYAVIDWLGTFDELLSGDSELAVGLREEINEDESAAPIVGDDVEEFIQYLRERV